jgi:hypothetical protein
MKDKDIEQDIADWRRQPDGKPTTLQVNADMHARCQDRRPSEGLDPGIERECLTLWDNGIETVQSCQGGQDHAYPEPTVEFLGGPGEGFRAYAIAVELGLRPHQIRRVWKVMDGEIRECLWAMTFWRPGSYKKPIIDDLRALLRRCLPIIEEIATGEQMYGSFAGGDPRDFKPDSDGDSATPEEVAKWKADCITAESGQMQPAAHVWVKGSDAPPEVAAAVKAMQTAKGEEPTGPAPDGAMHLAYGGYGLGTQTYRNREAETLLADLRAALESE